MGLIGRLTGFDQHQEALNAVIASHLVESASRDLKRTIADRIIQIVQQVRGSGTGNPDTILFDLSKKPRVVQMNFVALACNSLGIAPNIPRAEFWPINNPYRADNDWSNSWLKDATGIIAKRYGVEPAWPGNDARVDFGEWSKSAEPVVGESWSSTPTPPEQVEQFDRKNPLCAPLFHEFARRMCRAAGSPTDPIAAFDDAVISARLRDVGTAAYLREMISGLEKAVEQSLEPYPTMLARDAKTYASTSNEVQIGMFHAVYYTREVVFALAPSLTKTKDDAAVLTREMMQIMTLALDKGYRDDYLAGAHAVFSTFHSELLHELDEHLTGAEG